jgi:hypothetical protein
MASTTSLTSCWGGQFTLHRGDSGITVQFEVARDCIVDDVAFIAHRAHAFHRLHDVDHLGPVDLGIHLTIENHLSPTNLDGRHVEARILQGFADLLLQPALQSHRVVPGERSREHQQHADTEYQGSQDSRNHETTSSIHGIRVDVSVAFGMKHQVLPQRDTGAGGFR